ncbi:MAG: hypothetical protein C0505_06970 [Leptothrix sp. (in: Bacteria)]|nr:hypothetical protein [Leptothrix sp. (in: b-proteobacteria)]
MAGPGGLHLPAHRRSDRPANPTADARGARVTAVFRMNEAESDVLAFMTFPRAHWTQIYSTNPLEPLNAEIMRRPRVVSTFPKGDSITRLVGAKTFEQNDEWPLNRRCMQLGGLQSLSDTVPTRLSAVAR